MIRILKIGLINPSSILNIVLKCYFDVFRIFDSEVSLKVRVIFFLYDYLYTIEKRVKDIGPRITVLELIFAIKDSDTIHLLLRGSFDQSLNYLSVNKFCE